MELNNILESGYVERFHAVPHISKQTTGHHAWGVAMIAYWLLPSISKLGLMYALVHDCAELETGDVPFTLKKKSNFVKTLFDKYENDFIKQNGIDFEPCELEKAVVKLADMLEGYNFSYNRVLSGERQAKRMCQQWHNAIVDFEGLNDHTTHANDIWTKVNKFLTDRTL